MDADVCIVGAGIAGLFAACSLPEGTRSVVLDKGTLGEGSSPLAQGRPGRGRGARRRAGAPPRRHGGGGAGLVDRVAASVLCLEAPDRVRDLVEFGVRFDRNDDDSLHLAREGGQSVARSVHTADASGGEIVRALRIAAAPLVERVEAYAVRLDVPPGGACRGVWRSTLPVRGCWSGPPRRCWPRAERGAVRLDHEPAGLDGRCAGAGGRGGSPPGGPGVRAVPPDRARGRESPRPLLTEALRGAGAHLVDASGERFMVGVHPDAELAPRHVVTAAILRVGRAFLDCRSIGQEELERHFPTWSRRAGRGGSTR